MLDKRNDIGARLERLPMTKWHYALFWLLGLGLLIDGFDNYIGGIVLAQLEETGWTNNYLSAAFSSSTLIGLFIGSLLAGFMGDYFGRKKAFQINLLLFGAASIAAAFSTDMTMLIILRGIIGIGLGAEIVICFSTFTEFLPQKNRGKWVSRLSLIGNTAPPIATAVGFIVMPLFGAEYGWRSLFMIAGVAAIALWFARKTLPESPRWLASKGRYEEADIILKKVEKQVEEKGIQLEPIKHEAGVEQSEVKLGFSSLFKGPLLRRTILGIFVLIGMNIALYTVTTWIPIIFVQSGISISDSILMTTIILLGAPLGVFLASLIMDRFPRKWFGVSLLVIIASLSCVYALQKTELMIVIVGFFLILFLYVYVCFASAVYVPELWPTEARTRGTGFCTAIGRAVAISTPFAVAWVLTNFGSFAVFASIGAILLLVGLVIAFVGIETRGKSLEEIGELEGGKELLTENNRKNIPL
jgi:MFS transporter, putative metabolite:H+ symporter